MPCDKCFNDPCSCIEDFNTLAADEDSSFMWHEVVRPHLEDDARGRADELEEWFNFLMET